MTDSALSGVLVIVLLVTLALGTPIALALGAVGALGMFLVQGHIGLTSLAPTALYTSWSFILTALPMFVLMGNLLFRAKIGAQLFDFANKWVGHLPGGLGMASVGACTVFGAMCGVSSAGVATIGANAVPEMLRYGYDRRLATGAVATAGALAIVIPPSVPMLVYAPFANVSVGKLFIAGIVPALLTALLYCLLFLVIALARPELAPRARHHTLYEAISALRQMWAPLLLVTVVIGVMYAGVATPTEAAGVGALMSLLIGRFVYRTLGWPAIREAVLETAKTTAMIMIIVIGATLFSTVLTRLGTGTALAEAAANAAVPPWLIMLLIIGALVAVGCFLDGLSIITMTTPVIIPTVTALGYDPIWYGVILIITLEIGLAHPPVGLNLYVMKSVVPQVPLGDIIVGAIPFVGVLFVVVALLLVFPDLVMWLPNRMS